MLYITTIVVEKQNSSTDYSTDSFLMIYLYFYITPNIKSHNSYISSFNYKLIAQHLINQLINTFVYEIII